MLFISLPSVAQDNPFRSWKNVDLSHDFSNGMTAWPGAPGRLFARVPSLR
ncbi:MAG: hypothetical protein ACT4OY_01445 [Alphaproteobacteria bacterium]